MNTIAKIEVYRKMGEGQAVWRRPEIDGGKIH